MANYLPFFKICKDRGNNYGYNDPNMLRSVEFPMQDITKCIKEYRKTGYGIPNIEENICGGILGKDSCQVRFRMKK